ncbi:UDP-N-acetylenolpyruvoylglucosamine reductase [Lysobacteraceae bacterium NML08-0793]|nr:UDP-N-acetylenolpyruvoylglucosamine reductase [Xanthomonadaceae bacterium NML08-0793]
MHHPGFVTHTDQPLHNSFALPARARRLYQVDDVDALPEALQTAGADALMLGGGSNLLFVREYIDSAVQVLDARIEITEATDGRIHVSACAGASWHAFVMQCLAANAYGLENLALIPGTVGAAPIQNIGAYGVEVMDLIAAVQVHDRVSGQTRWWSHAECGFRYRDSAFKAEPQRHAVMRVKFALWRTPRLKLAYAGIDSELAQAGISAPGAQDVAEAVIRIRQRKLPDPARIGNAGSFFKNPIVPKSQADALRAQYPAMPIFAADRSDCCKLSAAWLIDQCGWKGKRQGDAGVSAEHALVLVNHGHASGAQILALAREIAASVQHRFAVAIEPEPRLIGAHW